MNKKINTALKKFLKAYVKHYKGKKSLIILEDHKQRTPLLYLYLFLEDRVGQSKYLRLQIKMTLATNMSF